MNDIFDERWGSVRLRPLALDDEPEILSADRELEADGFGFALGREPGMPWADYLARLEHERLGVNLHADRVPGTFLVADVGGQLVGRVSVRHRLNEYLAHEGGHIGFAVRPAFRWRGYATQILTKALVIARAAGVERVLITCEDANAGSAAVIERCGGVQESVVIAGDGAPVRRYWID